MVPWRILWLCGKFSGRMHVIHQQLIHVEDSFKDEDRIIDLGGGGEGVIGRLRGAQVTAVDIRQQELDDTPAGPVKVVADARRLPFPDRSFDAATAFFFLMYVAAEDRSTVLREAYRVLSPGGTLRIWDVAIPTQEKRTRKLFGVPVKAKLPDRAIATAYGVPWEGREMSADDIAQLARRAGFAVTPQATSGQTFRLVLTRPLDVAGAATRRRSRCRDR